MCSGRRDAPSRLIDEHKSALDQEVRSWRSVVHPTSAEVCSAFDVSLTTCPDASSTDGGNTSRATDEFTSAANDTGLPLPGELTKPLKSQPYRILQAPGNHLPNVVNYYSDMERCKIPMQTVKRNPTDFSVKAIFRQHDSSGIPQTKIIVYLSMPLYNIYTVQRNCHK